MYNGKQWSALSMVPMKVVCIIFNTEVVIQIIYSKSYKIMCSVFIYFLSSDLDFSE